MHCQVRCLSGWETCCCLYPIQRRDEPSSICEPSGAVGRDHCRSLGNANHGRQDQRTFILFHRRVQQLFRVLEQIVDHQAEAAASMENGFRVRIPHRLLEGFDFSDFVDDKGPFFPRVYLPREFVNF